MWYSRTKVGGGGRIFSKKGFSQQFGRIATLPNYYHGDIQTLNFKMT